MFYNLNIKKIVKQKIKYAKIIEIISLCHNCINKLKLKYSLADICLS